MGNALATLRITIADIFAHRGYAHFLLKVVFWIASGLWVVMILLLPLVTVMTKMTIAHNVTFHTRYSP